MTRSPLRDLLVGLFVLAGLGAIAYLSFSVGGLSYSGPGGLTIYAAFDQTGGLKPKGRPACRPNNVVKPTGKDQVLSEREMRIQMTLMCHHPDQEMRSRLHGRTPEPLDMASIESSQTRKAAQQCCFAGPVVSPQHNTFPCDDRKIDSA